MVMAKVECSQETVTRRVYIKSAFKNFEKFIGNSLYNLIKKRLYHSCFLVNLPKLLRTLLLQNSSGQFLLDARDLRAATGKFLKFWDLVIHGCSTEMLIWKNFQTFKANSSKEEPFLPISFTLFPGNYMNLFRTVVCQNLRILSNHPVFGRYYWSEKLERPAKIFFGQINKNVDGDIVKNQQTFFEKQSSRRVL